MSERPEERAIGIDIGGTKTAVGVVSATGRVASRKEWLTEPERGFEAGIGRIREAIDAVLVEAGWNTTPVRGIGIGCPGPLDTAAGTIENDYTLPGWGGRNVVAALAGYGVPVWLENDADAAAIGEAFAGAGRGCRSMVMLTFGTGIGGGSVVDGAVVRGLAGQHPELGHIPVDPDGPPCYCGANGCFESLASGTAIGASGLGTSREVFAAAERGEPAAQEVVARALRAAETAAWTIAHACLPERIVLAGGIIEDRFELFAAAMRRSLSRATQFRGEISVVRAALGADAGVVGAAHIALTSV